MRQTYYDTTPQYEDPEDNGPGNNQQWRYNASNRTYSQSYNQNKELIGNRGLTPVKNFLLNGRARADQETQIGSS